MYPVTVLLHALGQLLVFLSDLAVLLLFWNCIDANAHTVVLLGKWNDDERVVISRTFRLSLTERAVSGVTAWCVGWRLSGTRPGWCGSTSWETSGCRCAGRWWGSLPSPWQPMSTTSAATRRRRRRRANSRSSCSSCSKLLTGQTRRCRRRRRHASIPPSVTRRSSFADYRVNRK